MPKRRRCKQLHPHDPHPWNAVPYPNFGKRDAPNGGVFATGYWCTGVKDAGAGDRVAVVD
jgi:hypothetical protein